MLSGRGPLAWHHEAERRMDTMVVMVALVLTPLWPGVNTSSPPCRREEGSVARRAEPGTRTRVATASPTAGAAITVTTPRRRDVDPMG